LAAEVHLAGFAPAFTFSLCESESSRKSQVRIASVVTKHAKKRKTEHLGLLNTTFDKSNFQKMKVKTQEYYFLNDKLKCF